MNGAGTALPLLFRLAVFLLLAMLSGCLEAEVDTPHQDPPWPIESDWWLHQDGAARPIEAEGTSRLGWSNQDWFQGTTPPEWTFSIDGAAIVHNATAHVRYRALEAAVGSNDARPPLTAWFGSAGLQDHSFREGPAAVMPGDEFTATFEFRLPAGGLYVLPDAPLRLQLADYYVQESQSRPALEVLLDQTLVELDAEPISWPEPARVELLDTEAALVGSRCLAPVEVQGSATEVHEFSIPAHAIGLHARLERLGGSGGPDVDLQILGPDGVQVGGGHGSGSVEEVLLGPDNLAAVGSLRDWSARVYACQLQDSTYSLVIDALVPAS